MHLCVSECVSIAPQKRKENMSGWALPQAPLGSLWRSPRPSGRDTIPSIALPSRSLWRLHDHRPFSTQNGWACSIFPQVGAYVCLSMCRSLRNLLSHLANYILFISSPFTPELWHCWPGDCRKVAGSAKATPLAVLKGLILSMGLDESGLNTET